MPDNKIVLQKEKGFKYFIPVKPFVDFYEGETELWDVFEEELMLMFKNSIDEIRTVNFEQAVIWFEAKESGVNLYFSPTEEYINTIQKRIYDRLLNHLGAEKPSIEIISRKAHPIVSYHNGDLYKMVYKGDDFRMKHYYYIQKIDFVVNGCDILDNDHLPEAKDSILPIAKKEGVFLDNTSKMKLIDVNGITQIRYKSFIST